MKFHLYAILSLLLLTPALSARDQPAAAIEKLKVSFNSWTGENLPSYPRGQPEITVLKITIPPGVRLPVHKHPIPNAVVLLRGNLTVTTMNNRAHQFKAGDTLIEVVNEWHYGENNGKEPVEMIAFYAGTRGMPVTVKRK